MKDKIKIRESTIQETDIILWKNFTKNPSKTNYNITISKKGVMFLAVSSIRKTDLSYMISKYESILEWVSSIVEGGQKYNE
jgi:hypothetical protein